MREFGLVLGVASRDVVVGDDVKKVALILVHPFVESASVCQPGVAMRVWRVAGLRATPVGLQRLLDDLMAHKGHVESPACRVHSLCGVEVIIGYIEPVSHFVCCHNWCC